MTIRLLPTSDDNADKIVQRWVFTFCAITFLLHVWRIFSLNATYDQGLFLQEIWNGLHGRYFESTLASELSAPVLLDGGLPEVGYRHLAQHFTPLLVLWIPFVGLFGVWALPFIQVALITTSGWILFLLGKQYLPARISGWIACSFFTTVTVIGPALENFHDLCIVPLLIFSLLLGISRNQKLLYIIPALLLPLVREDVGLVSFGIGIWMIFCCPKWRVFGLGLCAYSMAYILIITNLIMPLFGSELSRRFLQERFSQYLNGQEGGTLDVLLAILRQPVLLIKEIISPPSSTFRFLLTLALPLAFIPWIAKDAWILIAFPLFVALSSKGGNALSVSLRFMLYLVPGIFSGTVFWWRNHIDLFRKKSFRLFWQVCLFFALGFAIAGNPHRSLSALIPDSVEPWVHVPISQAWERGIKIRPLINSLPSDASIAADTQLIPQLAQRRLLFRFPENYRYKDEEGSIKKVDYIITQPTYHAVYAAAFNSSRQWLDRSVSEIEELVANEIYGVFQCNDSSIVLKRDFNSNKELVTCFSKEVQKSRLTLQKLKA